MTAAITERSSLVATLRAAGPDAPTLCEGWLTRDITAHMVIREARPDAAPGIVIGPLAGYTERVQKGYAQRDYTALLDQLDSGPPWYSPFAVLDRFVNPTEFFVHHEDVRRAGPGWSPRSLSPSLQKALRRSVSMVGRQSLSSSPARVTLATTDGSRLVTAGKGPEVTVTGDVGELVMFVFGREEYDLAFAGDPTAVDALKAADRGL